MSAENEWLWGLSIDGTPSPPKSQREERTGQLEDLEESSDKLSSAYDVTIAPDPAVTIAHRSSQELWLPEQDPCKIKPGKNSSKA